MIRKRGRKESTAFSSQSNGSSVLGLSVTKQLCLSFRFFNETWQFKRIRMFAIPNRFLDKFEFLFGIAIQGIHKKIVERGMKREKKNKANQKYVLKWSVLIESLAVKLLLFKLNFYQWIIAQDDPNQTITSEMQFDMMHFISNLFDYVKIWFVFESVWASSTSIEFDLLEHWKQAQRLWIEWQINKTKTQHRQPMVIIILGDVKECGRCWWTE